MQECRPSLLQNAWQTNYYAIIYYHDHSKHINDHLRCRQDNGATCLNCKVDFSLEMLTTTSLLCPHPPLLKCKQSGSVPQLILPSLIHITCTHSCSFPSLPTFPSLSLQVFHRALVWSKTALWHCVWHPGSRIHQTTKEQLAKRQTQRDRGAHARACMCVYVCVINKWIN